ncbi:alkaline phosphatase, tissue-nonspecific isozyme-like isoform X3 [Apostichopus japonicus]|uniref:alkaline phosphatase, tissue-nonspecific isozyme-like isoform X3 n=1 Tax=Stichopus japonicus TaxID=307972 RepID=UPI003AB4A1A4
MMATELFLVLFAIGLPFTIHGQTAAHWNTQALDTLMEALDRQELNKNIAKNVVFFLGDGMGVSTVTAARILKGQLEGNTGEEYFLSWENFPHAALSKTYNTNKQVPDSAGTATAFFCGVKSYEGAIGVDASGQRKDCLASHNGHVASILKEANDAGKSTGIVSTTRVTHATPACLYAHSPDRYWENDAMLTPEAVTNNCSDIASQLIAHPEIQVVLGGGRREFLPNNISDPEYPTMMGLRNDGRNLVNEWQSAHPREAAYVWNKEDFDDVDPDTTEYVFGLFEPSHMQYESDRANDTSGEPSIAEMTEKAIQILSKNNNGFFLAVEGVVEDPTGQVPVDGLPYTTLGYLNGPGGNLTSQSFKVNGVRPNLTGVETNSKSFVNEALVPLEYETHGGEDVAIYASGPFAHLFTSVHEQHYIAHVIRYAACLGNGKQVCTDVAEPDPCSDMSASKASITLFVLLSSILAYTFLY